MDRYLFLIPLLPLLASGFNLLVSRKLFPEKAHLFAIAGVAGSFIVALFVFRDIYDDKGPLNQHLWQWIGSGSFHAEVGLYADQLTAVMLVMVTFVSLLVHIYSVGYMHGDPSYYRFFSWLPLFVFTMLVLVLANNYLLIFFGWEGVGLCSYLLIGYYYKRRSAANAAKKAFIVNRIGDVGFGLGIMLIFTTFGTITFAGDQGVFSLVNDGSYSERTLTAIGLLLFTGAIGKSAQFPLHVWLPDAMEGPTPVSALIHAATMVTAGIYLVARSNPIFMQAPNAMLVVATIGALTAFMGASIALVQTDIKRVIAYSTVSQLGYMALALGVGAWVTAIFHLVAHAFFKACLFLGSGSVIHGMHDEQDMRKMGGLRKFMPITFVTFLIASLANAGVFPFAGFWSKDEIITGAWASRVFPDYGNLLTVVGLIAAFLSALYMFRLVFLTFFGKPRFDVEHVHPHESPWLMTVPLIILAAVTIFFGALGYPPDDGRFHHFLEPVFATAQEHFDAEAAGETAVVATTGEHAEAAQEAEHHISNDTIIRFGVISTILALSGIVVAWLAFLKGRIDPVAFAVDHSRLYNFLYKKWYIDDLYDNAIVNPMRRLAMYLWRVIDVKVIDGTVLGIAHGVDELSRGLRTVQTGLVRNYALAIALGMVVIVGVYFAAFSDLFR
jgi:NADH-quinone oxidoreductase subunit L